ncbi:hypothetical protein GGR54DRAFT_100115 [Hypoxylon sp. NC1633]|nr:hypothetical protein GGR54DRAFT_100115 [Hypoxylon sp. NC1633]
MRTVDVLTLALTLCGAALAIPPPTHTPIPTAAGVVNAAADPDCASIEEYCKCKDDDFQCETDPNCEWCRAHNAWPPTSPTPVPRSKIYVV